MLKAAEMSGCDVFVISAFGCGANGHPPLEVAKLVRKEIEDAGTDIPLCIFSIIDDHNAGLDHNPRGNHQVFHEALNQSGKDPNWKAPRPVNYDDPGGNLGTAQRTKGPEIYVPDDSDRTEGPDAAVGSGPIVREPIRSLDAGGAEPDGSSPTSHAASYEGSSDLRSPYPSANTVDSGHETERASASGAEDQDYSYEPVSFLDMVIFPKSLSLST